MDKRTDFHATLAIYAPSRIYNDDMIFFLLAIHVNMVLKMEIKIYNIYFELKNQFLINFIKIYYEDYFHIN